MQVFGRLHKAAMSSLPDGLMVGGACAMAYGAWCIYAPAGHLVIGGFALAAGWLLSKAGR